MLQGKIYLNHHFAFMVFCLAIACMLTSGGPAHAEDEPVELTLEDAILMSLENNSSLQVELYKPELSEIQVLQEDAAFDTRFSGGISTSGTNGPDSDSQRTNLDLEISQALPSGGDLSFGFTTDKNGGGISDNQYSSRIGLSLSHPLFKGAGSDVNLSRLHQAELNTQSSLYELQAYAESLIAQVEVTYLDYLLAQRRLEIYEEPLSLAEQQLEETQVLVDVGKIAEVELVASQAEVALRKEGLINARSNLETLRLRLLRLLNPPGIDFWTQEIVIKDQLTVPDFDLGEIGPRMETAMLERPDLNVARILLERNALDLITTKNGLLPDMEFFVILGMTGYSDSFGGSFTGMSSSNNDFRFGLNYTYTFGDADSRARYDRSVISREQAYLALDNLEQLAREDVGSAWIEVNRAAEQITATSASLLLQEEKVRAETEKYRVGKSTSLLVAQAQRDLLASRIAEIDAIASYEKAVIELLKSEGTLLEWHGISLLEGE